MCRISSFVAESDHESAGSQVPEQQHLGAVHPADALQGTRDSAWLSTAGSYPVPAGCLSPPTGIRTAERVPSFCQPQPGPPVPLRATCDSHGPYLGTCRCPGQKKGRLRGARSTPGPPNQCSPTAATPRGRHQAARQHCCPLINPNTVWDVHKSEREPSASRELLYISQVEH